MIEKSGEVITPVKFLALHPGCDSLFGLQQRTHVRRSPGLRRKGILVDRVWLLTWTTYGSWLPGDDRGFVSNFADAGGKGHRRNEPGTVPASEHPGLAAAAKAAMAGPAVRLTAAQASAVLGQFHETAAHRGWSLLAAAVMGNHAHVVVGVGGNPEPGTLLRGFKAYASRRLNMPLGTVTKWWTEGGSTVILPDNEATRAAVAYVERQSHPLALWSINDPA